MNESNTNNARYGKKAAGSLHALPPKAAVVDPTVIPWLRLNADPDRTHGPGIFADTTFIQRVYTTSGKSPSENGTFVRQVAKVPYTAGYFFCRKPNN